MQLVLHRKVHSDVQAIMEYYERVASREFADDFYAELRRFMSVAPRFDAGAPRRRVPELRWAAWEHRDALAVKLPCTQQIQS